MKSKRNAETTNDDTFTRSRFIETLDFFSGGRIGSYFREGVALTGRDDDDADKYRPLSGNPARDLKPIEYNRARDMSFYEYQRYPIAGRIIDGIVDFTVARDFGVKVRIMQRSKTDDDVDTKRKDGQHVWEDFSEDAINRFNIDLDKFETAFLINGELALPAFVNEKNGDVMIGYYDPAYIKKVVLDPANAREVDSIVLTPQGSTDEITKKVIRIDGDPKSERFKKYIGECFFFRMNYILGATRGNPELLNVADWIDALEQFMFDTMEGFAFRNAFAWDITVKGGDEAKIKKMESEITVPRPGGKNIHNEKVEWKVLAPDLKATDANEGVRMFKNLILAGKAFPEHWFADGGNANRATAETMDAPTMAMFERKQKDVREMIRTIAMFVLTTKAEKSPEALPLAKDEYFDIEISMYKLDRKDTSSLGAALVQMITALKIAVESAWLSKEDAKKVVDGLLARMGIETDTTKTVEMIEEELAKRRKDRQDDVDEGTDVYDGDPPPPVNGKAEKTEKVAS